MHVIGTVGLAGSGKGEFADVAREEGIPVVTMGDVIREECRRRGLDPETHHGDVARRLREEHGEDAVAQRSLPTVRDALDDPDVESVVVDGLRAPVEADRFEAAFGEDFLLVSVEAPFEVRARRLRGRARDRSDADDRRLRERDERELGFGMGEVMDRAEVTVENTASLESFRRRVRAILAAPDRARAGELDLSAPEDGGDGADGADAGGTTDDAGSGTARSDTDDAGSETARNGTDDAGNGTARSDTDDDGNAPRDDAAGGPASSDAGGSPTPGGGER